MGIRQLISDSWCRVRYPQLSASIVVPSHLTNRERVALYDRARAPSVSSIVEIGSYLGASAAAFACGLRDTGKASARVYCVDTWNNDAMSDGNRDTMSAFRKNTHEFGDVIVPMRGWSTDVVGAIAAQAGTIDLLFIDGDHSYDACLADWQAYMSLLKPGGWVAFHDIGWAEGVQRVVAEEVVSRVRAQDRLPNLWWGQIA
jgi:predicted O-methyltransferase YrrM